MASNMVADVALSLIAPGIMAPTPHPHGPVFSPIMIAVHVGLVAFIAVECVAVFYYWLGRFWARWFVLAGCVFYLTGLRNLATQWRQSHFGAALTIGSALLAMFLIWYLYTRDVRIWFARSRATDATNK
jgi:hypothetical protein